MLHISDLLIGASVLILALCSIYDSRKIRRMEERIEALEDQQEASDRYQGIPKQMPH